MKVATIVGTRPEIIRLSRVMASLDRTFDHVTIHTGQNYDYTLNQIFYEDLELRKPDYFLEAAGRTAADTIGAVISKSASLLTTVNPEAVLILGDTNSCFAALAAKRQRIPVFHMEAGNRCFDQRVPEEINRRIIDHISDINMPYSSIAREHLLREGLAPDRIIKTGSPIYEVLHYYLPKIRESRILHDLGIETEQYFLVSSHREENVDNSALLADFVDLLNNLCLRYQLPVIVSTHPRTRKQLEQAGARFDDRVRLMPPMGYRDYVHLQLNARVTLSDSGTITEESSILNFPAINMRETHERLEGMEEGAVMMTGFRQDRVWEAIRILESQGRHDTRTLRMVHDYEIPNVSEKVVRIIQSYTDYVNRVVWRKPN